MTKNRDQEGALIQVMACGDDVRARVMVSSSLNFLASRPLGRRMGSDVIFVVLIVNKPIKMTIKMG